MQTEIAYETNTRLTIAKRAVKELNKRGNRHHMLRNMQITDSTDKYDGWLVDQQKRYALAIYKPNGVLPIK